MGGLNEPMKSPLGFTFEAQHALGCMESPLQVIGVKWFSRPVVPPGSWTLGACA
jgi:hypothetical protein